MLVVRTSRATHPPANCARRQTGHRVRTSTRETAAAGQREGHSTARWPTNEGSDGHLQSAHWGCETGQVGREMGSSVQVGATGQRRSTIQLPDVLFAEPHRGCFAGHAEE